MTAVRCYGRESQGNAVRRLMKNGDVACKDAISYLQKENNNNSIGNANDMISNEEIEKSCNDYGNLFCLFDDVFSILNQKRVL